MSIKARLLPTLTGWDPDESVDSSNLHRGDKTNVSSNPRRSVGSYANESGDSSHLRRGISSESVGSDEKEGDKAPPLDGENKEGDKAPPLGDDKPDEAGEGDKAVKEGKGDTPVPEEKG